LVIINDATLDRTTNGSGPVIERTLSEIKDLGAGGWFRDGAAGFRVPTLSQFPELGRDRAGIYIDIKHASTDTPLEVGSAQNMLK
jgi:glycerophosphoryl diester phosphodiesterase